MCRTEVMTRLLAAACFFFSSRRRHTRCSRDWSSDVCSSDLEAPHVPYIKMAVLVAEEVGTVMSGPTARFPLLPYLVESASCQSFILFKGHDERDRKSTRLNSSHGYISYAVFCLKKKKNSATPHGSPSRCLSCRLSRRSCIPPRSSRRRRAHSPSSSTSCHDQRRPATRPSSVCA